ncbi:alpha-L-rhamnosidase [Streptomyces sp. NPDC091292]|uniref:alpha-L-rhamnosidase n=1 Tax=Streptomyces sp. NPDC091292 TaxID=3365991 RepID=UPI003803B9BD
MISRRRMTGTAVALGAGLMAGPLPEAAAATEGRTGAAGGVGAGAGVRPKPLRVVTPTAEYVRSPLGLDVPRPRLSWPLKSDGKKDGDAAQSAYQIRVATSPGRLDRPDVWDSGKVASAQSVLVPYAGPELAPRTRYHWSVRVWDTHGTASEWSEPEWWETGLMRPAEWSAKWVCAPAALTNAPSLEGSSWIWFPEGDPASNLPAGTRWFRRTLEAPARVTRARVAVTADDAYTLYVNGTQVGHTDADSDAENWRRPAVIDVTTALTSGTNVLAATATNGKESPAGLLAVLEITTADGTTTVVTDDTWKTTDQEPSGSWQGTGFDDSAWRAARKGPVWGTGPWGKVTPSYFPATQLRHAFRLPGKKVAQARLYVTALGHYEAHLNGQRVGRDQLAPGWTDYRRRVQYQTYDVTKLVRGGDNAIGAHLGVGWYAGNIASFGPHHYGDRPALLAQLEVVHQDGTRTVVVSDTGWHATAGPITSADMMAGEDYDARRETPGWTRAGYDASAWQPVEPAGTITAEPVAEIDGPVRVTQELATRKVTQPRPGVHVFDLGQNMVGTVRLRVSGKAGTTIRLRHAEVLNPDGTLYTANLRSARATDTYTLKGGGEEVYEPRFTFHGFRYVEVTGHPGTPRASAVTGRVMHTSAPFTFDFSTDVPMLNQLHGNITWGQRGNFLSIPTDTPARDERLGWTGDINVFAPTAAYTMESARFLTKWLQDLRDAQASDGGITDVAPFVGYVGKGAAGWGDAGVTVPWALYQAYGDTRVLEDSWDSILKWLDYLKNNSTGHLRPASGYGDWLNIDDETPKDVIATAYYAHSADLTARIAKVLGKDPAPYTALFGVVRDAFRAAYVSDTGRIKGDTQTAYVLSLSMDLLPEALRAPAADRLVSLIEARQWHLSTGFLGTPRLLPVLTETGHDDVAYRLLHQKTFPSWGYPIERGATTMWERWDSIRPDGTFQDAGMNSFNHYAYGSVGEWMYAHIAGIAPGEPGYRHIVIRPRPGGEVRRARSRFTSLYGPIAVEWKAGRGTFELDCTVPVNTTAEVWIPAKDAGSVQHSGARLLRTEAGCAVYAVGSGEHTFRA